MLESILFFSLHAYIFLKEDYFNHTTHFTYKLFKTHKYMVLFLERHFTAIQKCCFDTSVKKDAG